MLRTKKKKKLPDIFEVMEKKLFYYIMRPAMIFTWIFGLVLNYLNGIEIFSQLMDANKNCPVVTCYQHTMIILENALYL
jgi:uncharacterized membrane protein